MTPLYQITMDCKTKESPIKRLVLHIQSLPRTEAILLAEHFMPNYKVAFVLAGHVEEGD